MSSSPKYYDQVSRSICVRWQECVVEESGACQCSPRTVKSYRPPQASAHPSECAL